MLETSDYTDFKKDYTDFLVGDLICGICFLICVIIKKGFFRAFIRK